MQLTVLLCVIIDNVHFLFEFVFSFSAVGKINEFRIVTQVRVSNCSVRDVDFENQVGGTPIGVNAIT